jgi:hypothetical protein
VIAVGEVVTVGLIGTDPADEVGPGVMVIVG